MDMDDECANCLLHGWKQAEDTSTLKKCKNCKVIKYCDVDCQTDHWNRVHKKQCRYFADPIKAERWDHKKDNCYICQQSAAVGQSQLRRPDNPNYECILEEAKKLPLPHLHPHPFPAGGQPGDTGEKVVIVLWQLLKKLELTHPRTFLNCQEEFWRGYDELLMGRLYVWGGRKICPQNKQLSLAALDFRTILPTIDRKLEKREAMADPFQLWKIFQLCFLIYTDVRYLEELSILLKPLADIPAEFHPEVSQALGNSAKFLAIANQILEALTPQVIAFKDILKIICDGSLQKNCSMCNVKIIIADTNSSDGSPQGPFVLFSCMFTGIYSCGKSSCRERVMTTQNQAAFRFYTAEALAAKKRERLGCDSCFKLPPREDVHRCSRCLTVMYCSKACQDKDWPVHSITCKDKGDVEDRKKKCGSSGRRKGAGDDLKEMQKKMEEFKVTEDGQVISGLLEEASKGVTKFRVNEKK